MANHFYVPEGVHFLTSKSYMPCRMLNFISFEFISKLFSEKSHIIKGLSDYCFVNEIKIGMTGLEPATPSTPY